ncbi:STAS domain-containing protein [Flaviaesturariibacter flavus]|uniref:STAS domain-containing protein n=1 Tax=Flaviaesturariibacter flavus TaxID=2502780 RepID=A0A4R1B3B9_9BACT|nr:STAS domain-containing protein [Flaviaesturariibacter flavus]TCJ12582.1 STAS domain-containing protein [Flaviaesturariibacter flavus]
MEVKTSTKEKFTVISGLPDQLSATMTEELCRQLTSYLEAPLKNIVLNMEGVSDIDEVAAEKLVRMQQEFYERGASFVACCMPPTLETKLDDYDLLELMNVTPSESEAWDIVQMEEIERELLDDEPDA